MLRANPEILAKLTTQTKCWMCKHRFDKPYLLPVEKPERGVFQPNVNFDVLFHMQDTHGLPHDIVRTWLIYSVYGVELNEFGAKGIKLDDL